ncbi:DUF2806 domain-containing protein [Marinomonas sp. A3A]|jgi:hemerythrin|uniref:DUF2806 domain-containing protein n=1 Tax=Marinomonas sp. (strain MWYL1) TaxID=400668 RepID=A6VTU9_MARMS|nr:DUF2806 domain-containing protein [Marinomonas sp. A3A]QUX90731.1 DUF2806 domain-containing protein [Marinomonas sp. A3A]
MAETTLIDLKALSEPACKLIDSVSNAIGVLYEPTRIRRKTKAESDALVIMAKGEADALTFRAAKRVSTQETRRQENIEEIMDKSLNYLERQFSNEATYIDTDWLSFYFDKCQDISIDNVQNLWAKILAGEVLEPEACSRGTLLILQSLSNNDIKLFNKYCQYLFKVNGELLRFKYSSLNKHLENNGIDESDIRHLQDAGLVQPQQQFHFTKNERYVVEYFDNQFSMILKGHRENRTEFLTKAGRELYRFIDTSPCEKYYEILLSRSQIMSRKVKEIR